MDKIENQLYVIAIDGPAASGKSTTARLVANQLQYVYIDTGAMYRACALMALQNGISCEDTVGIRALMDAIQIEICYSGTGNCILLNGENVTERIRQEDISSLSSTISTIGLVRDRMVELQREMGKSGGVVMDGRDIGTVVFPHADLKFFLIADVETRASRRFDELRNKGLNPDMEAIKQDLIWRDHQDMTRAIAPLRKADDAVEIDTSTLSIPQQVDLILSYVARKNA